MKPSTKDEVEGTFHETKGKVKEEAGKVTNNPNLTCFVVGEMAARRIAGNRAAATQEAAV